MHIVFLIEYEVLTVTSLAYYDIKSEHKINVAHENNNKVAFSIMDQ